MLIVCPECSLQVSDKAFVCPHCGFPMKKDAQIYRKKGKSIDDCQMALARSPR